MKHYHYIIAGAGCAGLSLAVYLADCARLHGKRILVIDKDAKDENDRTWCFWETAPGLFEKIVHRRWEKVWFHSVNGASSLLDIRPYTYKMIRSVDFYNHARSIIRRRSNFTIKQLNIEKMWSEKDHAFIRAGGETIAADYIFSSIPTSPLEKQKGKHYLVQHFRSWTIQADEDAFDANAATLMDFRAIQHQGVAFVYTLPVSATEAMVEYTLFSEGPLPQAEYEKALREHMAKHFPHMTFRVAEETGGVIPMTNHRFAPHEGRIVFIGTVGGQTKPSTGYTFRFIQQHSRRLTDQLAGSGHPYLSRRSGWKRFHFYDSVLLRMLSEKSPEGAVVFSRMFTRNPAPRVFRFFDNVSSLREELLLTMSLKKLRFIRAAWKELWLRITGH
ncbi:lycopene cyclase family protein [Chitinophaga barathri]|uniref:Lycopene cyclase n=1 Tax=Chitinophaga barathri TaxID=1647451 RepID=A0A3N4M9T7_9BACT|nr:lycopene cyclase family protein [Chitinophaga barathri]RPD40504.1 lycopene cyclase [Chitinophaga barathri]